MNDIDTRLRSTLDHVANTTQAENRLNQLGVPDARPKAMLTGPRVALAAFLVAFAAGIPAMVRTPIDQQNVGVGAPNVDPGSRSPLTPVMTLPALPDVSNSPPQTVADDHPSDWYRLAPDLDVAWHRDVTSGDNPSMLCLRTPITEQCVIDRMAPGTVEAIATGGGQTLVITVGESPQSTLTVTLSDGTTAVAPISWKTEIGWGVARFSLDPRVSVTGMQTS